MGAFSKRLPWLLPLIHAENKFHKKCNQHQKATNFYCLDCMDDPICLLCHVESEHKGHKIIQIFNTTHKKAVRVDDLEELIDCSGIQQLRNNGDKVIRIETKVIEAQNVNQHQIGGTKECRTCGFIFQKTKEEFCSLHCKVRAGENILLRKYGPTSSNGNRRLRSKLLDGDIPRPSRKQADIPSLTSSLTLASTNGDTRELSFRGSHQRKQRFPRRAPLI